MERLTYFENGHWRMKINGVVYSEWDFVDRLAAYEDTGLTPESVEALKLSMMGKAISEIKEFNGLPVDRLRELAEADKEGRVAVFPCKVGDTVYRLINVFDCTANRRTWIVKDERISGIPNDYMLIDGSIQLPLERFNKTVFLTSEKAERALQEMEGNA